MRLRSDHSSYSKAFNGRNYWLPSLRDTMGEILEVPDLVGFRGGNILELAKVSTG